MWYAVVGVIALVLSFFYFFAPEKIEEIDKIGSKVVLNAKKFVEKRKFIAFFYLIAGIMLMAVAFFR